MNTESLHIERRRYFFSGRVQGVGFRASALEFAHRRPLAGYVRNLSDGTVEMLLVGALAEIEGLVTDLQKHFGTAIQSATWQPDTSGDELFSFSLR